MSWIGIAENIISDILLIMATIFLSWLLLIITGRKRLLKFFGVDADRRLVVYLSNLRIIEGGAIGIDDRPRSYNWPRQRV